MGDQKDERRGFELLGRWPINRRTALTIEEKTALASDVLEEMEFEQPTVVEVIAPRPLVRVLQATNWVMRRQAACVLGVSGGAEAIPALEDRLAVEADRRVIATICGALSQLGSERLEECKAALAAYTSANGCEPSYITACRLL